MNMPVTPPSTEIAISQINAEFANTRTRILPEAVETLKASIAVNGLINPLTVTPIESDNDTDSDDTRQYRLVAGFTRFEALKALDYSKVKVNVVYGDEDSLLEIQVAENTARTDLSLSAEILALRKMITQLGENADIDTLGARLGWTTKQVRERQILAKSHIDVLHAFDNNDIKLGHAIALAGFSDTIQQNTLKKIIEEKWSVEETKIRASKVKLPLSLAKFDTTECQTCPSNSSFQGDLFGESVDAGMCSQSACFKAKSELHLETVKAQAISDYGTVIMLTETDMAHIRPIKADVLGDAQIEQCNLCPNSVAILNDKITDNNFTVTRNGICNNLSCYKQCATTYAESQHTASPATDNDSNNATDTSDAPQQADAPNTQGASTKPKSAPPVSIATLSNSQRVASQLSIANAGLTIVNDTENFMLLTCHAILSLKQSSRSTNIADTQALLTDKGLSGKAAIEFCYAELTTYLSNHANRTNQNNELYGCNDARSMLIALVNSQEDSQATALRTQAWTPDALDNYTIAGILMIAKESGFTAFYEQSSPKKTLSSLSKKDLLTTLKTSEFDWSSYAPTAHLNLRN